MLGDKEAVATIAVKDLKVAAKFYEETLGLRKGASRESGALTYATGKTTILVYESRYAGTNQATAVSWNVGDEIEKTARELKGRGVVFEHYDLPGVKREGDFHISGATKAAWFKDPDGNIHALVSG
jgi:catechol-2,3-dioxygenase